MQKCTFTTWIWPIHARGKRTCTWRIHNLSCLAKGPRAGPHSGTLLVIPATKTWSRSPKVPGCIWVSAESSLWDHANAKSGICRPLAGVQEGGISQRLYGTKNAPIYGSQRFALHIQLTTSGGIAFWLISTWSSHHRATSGGTFVRILINGSGDTGRFLLILMTGRTSRYRFSDPRR